MDTTVGIHSVHQVLVEGKHLHEQVPRNPANEKRGRNSIRSPHQVVSPIHRSTTAGRSYSPPNVFEVRSTTRSASPELTGRSSQRRQNLKRVSKLRTSKKQTDPFVEVGDCSVSAPVRTSQLQLSTSQSTSPAFTIAGAVKGERKLRNRTFFSENNERTKSVSLSQSDHPLLESILNKENFQTNQQYNQRSNLKRFSVPSKAAIPQGEHLETSHILLKSAPQRFSSIQKMKQHQQHQLPSQQTTSRIRSRRSFSRERESGNNRDEANRFYSNPVSPASDDEQEGDLVRGRYDSDDSLDDDLLVPSFRVSSLRSGGTSARRRSSRRIEALSTSILSSSTTPNGIHYSLSSSSLSKYSTPQKTGISSDTTTSELHSGDVHHNYGISKTFPTGGNTSGTPSSTIGNSMNSTSPVSPPASGIGQGSIHNHLHNSNNRRHTIPFFHSRQKQQNRNWFIVCLHSVVNNFHDQFFGPSTIVISPRFKIRQGSRTWTGFITLVTSVFILSYFGAYLHTFYQTSTIVYQGTYSFDTTKLRFAPGTTNASSSSSLKDSKGVFGSWMHIFSRTEDFDHRYTKHATTNVMLDDNLQSGHNTTITSLIHGTSLLANLKRPHAQTNAYKESLDNVRKVIQNVQLINSADVGSVDDQIHDYTTEKDKGSAKIKENVVNADTSISRLRRPHDTSRKESGSTRPGQPVKNLQEMLQQTKRSGVMRPNERSAGTADFNEHHSEITISKTNLRRGRIHNALNVTNNYKFTPTSAPKDNYAIATDARSLDFGRFSNNAPLCGQVVEDEISFTLVTQMSLNRLWMMKYHCERWILASGDSHQLQGRISIAVYVGKNTSQTSESILGELVDSGCPDDATTVQTISGYSDEEYPVNALRNLALTAVTTSHVVYVDVDFWVSSDLHQNLLHHRDFLSNHPKSALVIPAFQLNRQCRDYRECPEKNVPKMPSTRDDLVMLMVHGKASTFDPTNRGGHSSTRYRDWYEYQASDELLPIECVNSNRYEPYLVFRYCHDLPPFQEAFTGYGKNKMTWIMQLRYAGYDFHQIGGSFVVHYPHLESSARLKWNGGKDGKQLRKPKIDTGHFNSTTTTAATAGELEAIESLQQKYKRAQIDHTFIEFRSWLEQEYGHPDDKKSMIRIPKCHDAMNDDEKLWAR